MDKDETLIRERLARLHGHSGKSSSRNDTALQGRLDALSGRSSCAEGASENFNNRLASLLLPAEGGNASPTTVEDLSTRLSRLTSGNSGDGVASASPVKQPPHRAYGVPEDYSDEWEDLDDLLEAAVDEDGSSAGNLDFNGNASVVGRGNVDAKLSEIDALLKVEAAEGALGLAGSRSSSCIPKRSATSRAEDAGVNVNRAMEAFLGGAGGEGQGEKGVLRQEELGEEEERLLQMVTDHVRLEGHGVTERISGPGQEPPGEMWLPLAPTSRPTVSGGSGGGVARHHPMSNADLDPRAAAGLITQQAMDEARLGLGTTSEGETPPLIGKGGKGHPQQQRQQKKQDSSSWCCICSEDATLGCEQCEAENGQEDEPELFCVRCFKEVHRGDPEMEAHRPQALSRERAAGEKEHAERKGFRGWRQRK